MITVELRRRALEELIAGVETALARLEFALGAAQNAKNQKWENECKTEIMELESRLKFYEMKRSELK